MPQQEVFFEYKTEDGALQILKTYDRSYAREVLGRMDEEAQAHLWSALKIDENYEPADVPPLHDPDTDDFLWNELLDAAREDGNLLSFFVVSEASGGNPKGLYVSPDWPSAEAFAKKHITTLQ
jgi:hypothetical protein